MSPQELAELDHAITRLQVSTILLAKEDADLALVLKAAKRTAYLEREAADEEEGTYRLILRLGALLTGVVNAIRGVPEPGSFHSHHDAPELVQELVKERDELKRRATSLTNKLTTT